MRNRKSLHAFTLVELMVTLAIASVLVGIATPSLQSMISNSRLTSNTNQLVGALSYARSEAVKRGIQVTIIPNTIGGVWESGWYIFVDADDDNVTNPAVASQCLPNQDCWLRTYEALPKGYTLRSGTIFDDRVTFMPSGQIDPSLGVANDSFTLCDGTHNNTQSRKIIVSQSGRARTEEATGICP
jgi:type IV fimbrial biogenesis protein FimT